MYIGILGGSFNPVHIGHLRLAIETLESKLLPAKLDRIDLIPCSIPPHKASITLLPFELRLAMLKAATAGIDGLHINPLEQERSGPSYTYDTLTIYKQKYPNARLLFIVGGEDFSAIPQWFRGLELPNLADIGMTPRDGHDIKMFHAEAKRHWPQAEILPNAKTPTAQFEHGTRLLFLPQHRLDISASYIRKRWCAGQSVRMLMPDPALEILEHSRKQVSLHWKEATNDHT